MLCFNVKKITDGVIRLRARVALRKHDLSFGKAPLNGTADEMKVDAEVAAIKRGDRDRIRGKDIVDAFTHGQETPVS